MDENRYKLILEKVVEPYLPKSKIDILKELERMIKMKYNAVNVTVTKQVTQSAVVLLSDEDVVEIQNSDGEMDSDSFHELKENGRAFYTDENTEETIHSVEMDEDQGEES